MTPKVFLIEIKILQSYIQKNVCGGDFMLSLEELFQLSDAEKDFYELFLKYPAIHENPPKTLEQILENEKNYPEYKKIFDKHFGEYAPLKTFFRENLFHPREDVALFMHQRFVPGFLHYHEFFEITYVFNGHYRSLVNGKFLELNKGDICILSPNVWHCPLTHLQEDVVCNILVKDSTFEKVFFHILKNDPILSNFFNRVLRIPSGGSYLIFSTQDSNETESILLTMLSEHKNQKIYYSQMLNELMSALFVMLLRNHALTLNTAFDDELNFSQKIIEVVQYIRDNIQSITLPKLAKKFSYSQRQIARLLLKYTGKNFSSLIQEIRIQKACELLEESKISITEIILQCGYKNQNYFYTIFKKHFGITPAQYRKETFR